MTYIRINASVSLSSNIALGGVGIAMNFKSLPDTDKSALEKCSFAKFMTNFLFALAKSFNSGTSEMC